MNININFGLSSLLWTPKSIKLSKYTLISEKYRQLVSNRNYYMRCCCCDYLYVLNIDYYVDVDVLTEHNIIY